MDVRSGWSYSTNQWPPGKFLIASPQERPSTLSIKASRLPTIVPIATITASVPTNDAPLTNNVSLVTETLRFPHIENGGWRPHICLLLGSVTLPLLSPTFHLQLVFDLSGPTHVRAADDVDNRAIIGGKLPEQNTLVSLTRVGFCWSDNECTTADLLKYQKDTYQSCFYR